MWDGDEKKLETPEHDDLCIWSNDNIKKILKEFGIGLIPKEIEWEKPIWGKYNITGYIDLFVNCEDTVRKIIIEVKPKVYSIGSTIRQIKKYKSEYMRGRFNNFPICILITKTKGIKELFKTQNIFVYEVD